ncbi:MAG: GSCFA domain-containing protein [Flammeovirgaceae bacterium]
MKPLRTELFPKTPSFTISLADRILTLGSCFADAMGQQLVDNKFRVQPNPFGTVYNPLSIHRLLIHCLANRPVDTAGFLTRDGVHFHYDFHSAHAADSKEMLEEHLQQLIRTQHEHLKQASVLVLTYGTAFIYRRKDNRAIVANCHKIPAAQFTKHLLTVEQVVEDFNSIAQQLRSINPNLRIVLTVSPVRHVKDGLEENSVSKSILRLACHTLAQEKYVVYFPSYELMMDDLRDYRFYKTDRLHPTEEAEEYIWEKFVETYMSDSTQQLLREWQEIQSALHHKPFQPQSTAHQQFLQKTLQRIQGIADRMDVRDEIAELQSKMYA